eukprot:TRINITY_DN1187_c1_g1_i1.p1 TRINITY_DN1187_c1_g1~~TRINITY_DN1187_c1_g1_i1.p1  ORF type:complete len:223 (+),score=96.82 TRINITY_DN1187_c1_g1_i1:82-750(+)
MRLNAFTIVRGERVHLVPYERRHVPRYHAWMESDELRELTASERLTLEQEYEMQQSWLLDDDKLTFIILRADRLADDGTDDADDAAAATENAMIGDVNVYINGVFEAGEAEIEVMIAEESARRLGLAREALALMMTYARTHLAVDTFIAKINATNTPSRRLFQSIGFRAPDYDTAVDDSGLFGTPNVFGEVELRSSTSTDTPDSLDTVAIESRDDVPERSEK